MRKVGIITVYENTNYGSKLQTYALKNVLKSLGVIGENINCHIQKTNKQRKRIWNIIRKPWLIIRFILRRRYCKREELFNDYLRENIMYL